jgi:hypothetical protein
MRSAGVAPPFLFTPHVSQPLPHGIAQHAQIIGAHLAILAVPADMEIDDSGIRSHPMRSLWQ